MTTTVERTPVPTWDLADRLNKSLRHADVSVQQIADYLGVHRNTISAWLHGRGKTPPQAMLVAWAVATSVDYEWLTTGSEPENDGPGGAASANAAGTQQTLRLPRLDSNQQPFDWCTAQPLALRDAA